MHAFRLSAFVVLALSGSALAQSSPLVLIGGYTWGPVSIVQNGQLIRQWDLQGGGSNQTCLAVNETIRTLAAAPGEIGLEYDFNGDPTGKTFPNEGADTAFEGTTDGTHNYCLGDAYDKRRVYRCNADWSDPQPLFGTGMSSFGGITYDARHGTIWASQGPGIDGKRVVREFDMHGKVLTQWTYPKGDLLALAYEPATDTLWGADYQPNTLYQFDKQGNVLQVVPLELGGENHAFSAEFAILAACYPDFTGDGVLDLFDFLSFANLFNAGGPEADCTGDGGLDLFDFLCFVSAFNEGC